MLAGKTLQNDFAKTVEIGSNRLDVFALPPEFGFLRIFCFYLDFQSFGVEL